MVHDEMGIADSETDIPLSSNNSFKDCPMCWQNFITHLQTLHQPWTEESSEKFIAKGLAKHNARLIPNDWRNLVRFKTSEDRFFFILRWSAT